MRKSFISKITKRLKDMISSFEEKYLEDDVDAYDDEEDDDCYLDEDDEYYDNLGINKYHITFDFEVPVDEAEDSINDLKKTFFRKMEKAYSDYEVYLGNLTISTEREYDPEDFEEVEMLSFRDVVNYFKPKNNECNTDKIPVIEFEQPKMNKGNFTVISGGKDTINL